MNHRAAVIGLGVMGQRMLGSMSRYDGFDALVAYDPDEAARARVARDFPGVRIAASASDAITDSSVNCVYIACPPSHHEAHALAAFDAGKAVWCEKPLGVDLDSSISLVEAARRSGQIGRAHV